MKDSFGLRLRYYRAQKDLTQQELALKSGVSRKQISDLEMEIQKNPRPSTIKKLADALGIKEEKLSKENFEFLEDENTLDLQISKDAHEKLVFLAQLNNLSIEEQAKNILDQAILQEEKKISTETETTNDGKVVISKEYYDELIQIKAALRKLSMAVLDLENHKYDFERDPSSSKDE